jgi:multidrug efflux pump subunit AcrA (membrane-fusion protein)
MKTYLVCAIPAALALSGCRGCHTVPDVHAQRKELIETVYASGKIIPDQEYSLSALCSGKICRKLVRDGDTVRKGQVLFEISAEEARNRTEAAAGTYEITAGDLSDQGPRLRNLSLALRNATLRLQNDSLTYQRWKQLWNEGIGTNTNLDNCRMRYEVARNEKEIAREQYQSAFNELRVARNNARTQLGLAQKELEEYSVRSDRDGVVYQTFKEAGEAVRANEVVALVGDRRTPLIRLAVDQQDIDRIRQGQLVLVQADASGNRIDTAQVSRIYPVMNEVDQTFRVDARFTDVRAPLFIHSSVEANIIIRRKAGCLVLPRIALAGKDSVQIEVGRKQKTVRIETGIATLDDIEVLSGIDENTVVKPPAKMERP